VLVVGGEGVLAALTEAGLVPVWSADDTPVAVLQGWGFDLTWQQLNEAAIAIHRGAHWVATNTDLTRPTDRGLVPGNGAAVAAVAMAVPVTPEVAGKPYRPLLDDTVARIGARRPVFVGDRLDTDIAGAVNAGLDSMLVLTGSHGAADLLVAGPGERPSHLGSDLRALLEPPLVATAEDEGWRCGPARAVVRDGAVEVGGAPAAGGHADGAVERHPGHELPVDEGSAAAPGLPDALVGVVPVLAEPVHHGDDVLPALVADAPVAECAAVEGVDRVHGLAVDVELELVGGAVAYPHGAGAPVAVEVVERLLGEVGAAVDAVHDPEWARAVAAVCLHAGA
jgi:hypothetical protein